MLLEGNIKQLGVLTPEEVFKTTKELEEFFDRYAKYCGKNLTGKDILLKKIVDL